MKYLTFILAMFAVFIATHSAVAVPVAQWRWEAGPANTDVIHTLPDGQFEGTIPDLSGNGNTLSPWSQGGCCGYGYRTDVPYTKVPLTGATNSFSVKNTGGGPGMFTTSTVSLPSGVDLETMMPTAFTVEVSWKPENGGFRTVVGRDAQNVATADGALAALYMVAQPDNSMAIKFADAAGNFHQAVSLPNLIQGFDFGSDPNGVNGNWYNIAGVSDGTTLKLYVNNALVASTPIVSADPRLAIGTTSGGDWHAGEWSVGRGLFNGGHGDRAYGYIDEVRISNSALTPTEFLVPTALSVTVNTVTGAVTLKNDATVPVNVDFYRIGSAGGALNFGSWNSLDDQNFSAVDGPDGGSAAGDSPGEGWDQAAGSSANQLIEEFLSGAGSTIAASQTLSLGNAFNPAIFGSGVNGDLAFSFGYNGGPLIPANVTYVTASPGVLGDYNNNGVVDAADYVLWRNNGPLQNEGVTPGSVTPEDYTFWRSHFGNTSGSGVGNAAVPEPATWFSGLAVAALLIVRRRGITQ